VSDSDFEYIKGTTSKGDLPKKVLIFFSSKRR